MKKILYGILSAAGILSASEVADISQFKDVSGLTNTGPVFVENFESGAKRWKLPDGFSLVREGFNGSGALVYHRQTPQHYKFAYTVLKGLDHRQKYKLTITYRSELKEDPTRKVMEVFDIRFFKNKKMIKRIFYPRPFMNVPNWQEISKTFTIPADADTCVLQLMITPKRVGKLWYDNIRIEPDGNAGEQFHLTKPEMLQLNKDKEVEFKFSFSVPPTNRKLALIVDANGKKFQFPVKKDVVRGNLTGVNDKIVNIEAILVDLNAKTILNRNRFVVYNQTTPKPVGAVTFDEKGRTLVDGKPYLPIGIFLGFLDVRKQKAPEVLQQIEDAGFNMLLSLGTHKFSFFGGVKPTHRESMIAALDTLQKHNLKFIYGIKYQMPSQRHYKEMDHVRGLENVNRYIVDSVKNHPAMFAWYVSDENPLDQLPEVQNLRRQISSRDPWHPTLTLTDKTLDMFSFAATGDVLMVDPYPIGRARGFEDKPQNMQQVRDHLDAAVKGGTPVWLVPQIFSWSSFQPHQKHRYPTETEIRSMVLQGMIREVKGYVFYAHHAIFLYSEKYDPGKSAMQWNNVRPVIKLLREMTPFILSNEKAPEIKIKQISGKKIEAKCFRSKGKTVVVIAAVGPGEAKAEITVPKGLTLKSRFGKTIHQGNGVYLFTGKDVDSDLLEM